jgi:ubiquinone/menaquinone biosynthesis C-methylase UbiE
MSIRATLFRLYWALRRVIAPGLRFSQVTYEEALRNHVAPGIRWIDIGCGRSLLPSWRAEEEVQLVKTCKVLVGIDYDLPSLKMHPSIRWKVRADVGALPFKSGCFDLVTANMVVEHLDRPSRQFQEVNRILSPQGRFLFHTPNALGYGVIVSRLVPEWLKRKLALVLQGRKDEDVFKTFYRANTEKQLTELAGGSGFKIARIDLFNSDAILGMIPPLAFFELLWLRLLMTRPFRPFRTNMIALLQKADN